MENARRSLVKIIKELCYENFIQCDSFSYDWIFRLSRNGKTTHIFGYQFENNSSTAQLICSDKCSASDILIKNNISAIEHHFFMSPTNIKYVGVNGNWNRISELLQRYGKIVCKSNEGSGGNNIYIVETQFELEQAAYKIFNQSRSMAVCKYYRVSTEYRAVVLNGFVKLVYEKRISSVIGDGKSSIRELTIKFLNDNPQFSLNLEISPENSMKVLEAGERFNLNWKHNLGQGAEAKIVLDILLLRALSDLALEAANAVNIKFASVDIVATDDDIMIMEINSGVMMEHFSQMSDENYQIAKSIYREAIESMLCQNEFK